VRVFLEKMTDAWGLASHWVVRVSPVAQIHRIAAVSAEQPPSSSFNGAEMPHHHHGQPSCTTYSTSGKKSEEVIQLA
jgi:hypothetical protein